MLHVILLILKILGIILLIAAGLLLAALYAVLFVGVSWRIRAEREERFQVAAHGPFLSGRRLRSGTGGAGEALWPSAYRRARKRRKGTFPKTVEVLEKEEAEDGAIPRRRS